MEIKIEDKVREIPCDVLVIGKFEGCKTSNPLVDRFAPETFTGKKGETFVIHTQKEFPSTYIMALGLGQEEKADSNSIREAVSKAVRKCIELKAKSVAFDIPSDVEAVVLGVSIVNYHFDKYKTKKEHRISEIYLSESVSGDLERAKTVAESMKLTRNLANEPAAFATPSKLAEIAQGFEGLQTVVYDEAKIREMGMGAYLAVAQGSVQPPKFIHMKYIPEIRKNVLQLLVKVCALIAVVLILSLLLLCLI